MAPTSIDQKIAANLKRHEQICAMLKTSGNEAGIELSRSLEDSLAKIRKLIDEKPTNAIKSRLLAGLSQGLRDSPMNIRWASHDLRDALLRIAGISQEVRETAHRLINSGSVQTADEFATLKVYLDWLQAGLANDPEIDRIEHLVDANEGRF